MRIENISLILSKFMTFITDQGFDSFRKVLVRPISFQFSYFLIVQDHCLRDFETCVPRRSFDLTNFRLFSVSGYLTLKIAKIATAGFLL